MTMVEAQNLAAIRHQFSRMRGFSARSSAGIEHPLPRLGCKEISAQDGRLVLDSKPAVSITLEPSEGGMQPDANPVGSISAGLCLTAPGRQRIQETSARGALRVQPH